MIAAGIGCSLVAAVTNALSVVLQAAEARRSPDEESMHVSLLRRLAHRPRWLLGAGLMAGAGVLQVVALALAPITVVQPMLATSQLALLAIARWKLHQRVGGAELAASLVLIAGLSAVVWASPHHTLLRHAGARVIVPLLAVLGAALLTSAIGRWHARARMALIIGAGLAYAWADFANKLLADDASSGRWAFVALWVFAVIAIGALAFLQENSALQHRPAVTVAPVIGAVKTPLPVLMALWAGVETWSPSVLHVGLLLGGLALVVAGASILSRSETIQRLSGGEERTSSNGGRAPADEEPARRPALAGGAGGRDEA